MNKEWSELNKRMQTQIKKKDTYKEGLDTLFDLRDQLMQTIVSFKEELSREDFDAIPFLNADGYHSKTIAYSIWHIFRIEDIVANILISEKEQVFSAGGYQERINPPVITTGNELVKQEIADFSKQLNLNELYSYIFEVKESTEEMLKSPSSAKRAELAAARIFEIRQTRSDIISGNADQMPGDGQAMKLALDNLAAQEAALTAMFAGTTQTSTQVRTYTVMPPEQNKKMVVARLSVTDGLVDADNLTGDPIYLDISVKQRGELPKNDKGEPKKFPKGGLAYRVPGTAGVTAEFDGRQLDSRDLDVAQYGVVFGLEPGMFTDKKAPAYAVFNPASGALVELGTNE